MPVNSDLISELNTKFVDTGKFSSIAKMFTKDSLREMGYIDASGKTLKPLNDSNIDDAISDYLAMNRKYLANMIAKSPELKGLDIDSLNQDELAYSLFVNGVGATFKKLKEKDVSLYKEPEIKTSDTPGNFVASIDNVTPISEILDVKQEEAKKEISISDLINQFDAEGQKKIDEENKQRENQKILSDNLAKQSFVDNYYNNYPSVSVAGQLGVVYSSSALNKPIIPLQFSYAKTLFDATDVNKLSEQKGLSEREVSLAREFSRFNFAFSSRPAGGYEFAEGEPTSFARQNFMYARPLDLNIETKFGVGKESGNQAGITLGWDTYFHPVLDSYKMFNRSNALACGCTGSGTCSTDGGRIPLASGIHSDEVWTTHEYSLLGTTSFSTKHWDFVFGYKPKGNFDHIYVDGAFGVPTIPQVLSPTYTFSAFNIQFDDKNKENNIAYASTVIRPDAVSRVFAGNVHKTDGMMLETGVDLVSRDGSPKELGIALANVGVSLPVKISGEDKGVFSVHGTIGENFISDRTMAGIKSRLEYNLLQSEKGTTLKGIVGAGVSNLQENTHLPPEVPSESYTPNVSIGLLLTAGTKKNR